MTHHATFIFQPGVMTSVLHGLWAQQLLDKAFHVQTIADLGLKLAVLIKPARFFFFLLPRLRTELSSFDSCSLISASVRQNNWCNVFTLEIPRQVLLRIKSSLFIVSRLTTIKYYCILSPKYTFCVQYTFPSWKCLLF